MRRYLAGLVAFFFLAAPSAAPARHRATRPPVSDATPAGWLSNHAYRLDTMEPLRAVAGNAPVVALGDDTHGTHEFFELKLKMIQFLVREMKFTTIGFEAPFADFNRLNQYILGAPGDPYTPLMHRELGYWFWASEEIVAVVEWAREYNRTRGDRPPVEIAELVGNPSSSGPRVSGADRAIDRVQEIFVVAVWMLEQQRREIHGNGFQFGSRFSENAAGPSS